MNEITSEGSIVQSKTDHDNDIVHRHNRKLLNWWEKKNDEPIELVKVQKRKFVADEEEFRKFVTMKEYLYRTGEKKAQAQPSWSYDYGGRKMMKK